MTTPKQPNLAGDGASMWASASDDARVSQAGRDMAVAEQGDVHVHYEDGPHGVRRVLSDPGDVACPYPGLSGFGPAQSRWFFGRDALTAELIGRVADGIDSGGPVMVVGPSGAGKSSVLQAGLLPAIDRGALPASGSAEWPRLAMTPTAHPQYWLAARLAPVIGMDRASTVRLLATDPDRVILLIRHTLHARYGGARAIVVVDQLEELFTLCADEAQRRDFVGMLARLAARGPADEPPVALVVCGLRSDFYTPCADHPVLRTALQSNQVFVGQMSPDELRAAILFPARAVGMYVEPGLVELLLADLRTTLDGVLVGAAAGYEAGRLPLLAHALRSTWQQRHGATLTVAGYRTTGGIHGAVAKTAERVYNNLHPTAQQAARMVFLQLVTIGSATDGIEDTRRRVTHAELNHGTSDPGVTWAVLHAFTQGRLLTQGQDNVEITHEALLWAWPRLRGWLDTDRAGNLLRQELETTARTWKDNRQDSAILIRGSRLDTARTWVTGHKRAKNATTTTEPKPLLSGLALDFLAASLRQQRRTARIRRSAVALLATLALLASATAILAFRSAANAAQQSANAAHQHATAVSRQLAAESISVDKASPVLARQLAVAARSVADTSQANSAVSTLLAEQGQGGFLPVDPGLVDPPTFSPDGRMVAVSVYPNGGNPGAVNVRLWNLATGQPIGADVHATGVPGEEQVAFRSDSRVLAVEDNLGTGVRLVNTATGEPVEIKLPNQPGRPGLVLGFAFLPNGQLLTAYDNFDGSVQLWNAMTGRSITVPAQAGHGAQYAPFEAALSPGGGTLATATSTRSGSTTVRLWNTTTGRAVGAPLQMPGEIRVGGITFSPDGQILAVGDVDSTLRLWNPRTGQSISANLQDNGTLPLEPGSFSANGQLFVSIAIIADKAQLWNTTTGQLAGTPVSLGQETMTAATFSPDGQLLATVDSDNTLRFWNSTTGQPVGQLRYAAPNPTFRGNVTQVAFSPVGNTLAINEYDTSDGGAVELANTVTGHTVLVHGDTGPGMETMAFAPDARILATNGTDGIVRFWNPDTGQPIGTPVRATSGPGVSLKAIAFSPNGHLLATGDFDRNGDGAVRLWNLLGRPVGGPLRNTYDTDGSVDAVAFSPDGRILAAAYSTPYIGTVQLWDPATGQPIGAPLRVIGTTDHSIGSGKSPSVNDVAFSPDGHILATATNDGVGGGGGTVQLWNVATGQSIGGPIHVTTRPLGSANSVAFSPDGRILATAATDDVNGATVQLWNVATGEALDAPLPVDSPNSFMKGVAFSPDGRILAAASGSGTVWLALPALLINPYRTLCTDVGLPTAADWNTYASGESEPSTCG